MLKPAQISTQIKQYRAVGPQLHGSLQWGKQKVGDFTASDSFFGNIYWFCNSGVTAVIKCHSYIQTTPPPNMNICREGQVVPNFNTIMTIKI